MPVGSVEPVVHVPAPAVPVPAPAVPLLPAVPTLLPPPPDVLPPLLDDVDPAVLELEPPDEVEFPEPALLALSSLLEPPHAATAAQAATKPRIPHFIKFIESPSLVRPAKNRSRRKLSPRGHRSQYTPQCA